MSRDSALAGSALCRPLLFFLMQRLMNHHFQVCLILQSSSLGLAASELNVFSGEPNGGGRSGPSSGGCAVAQCSFDGGALEFLGKSILLLVPPVGFVLFTLEVLLLKLFSHHR